MQITIKLCSTILLIMFTQFVYGQSQETPLKKGEAYYVLIENKLIFTEDVYALLDQHKGKTKLILQNEKAKAKSYVLPKAGMDYLADFEYLKITTAIPWRLALCKCWNGYQFITLGCGKARGDQSKCAECCNDMDEELSWIIKSTMK